MVYSQTVKLRIKSQEFYDITREVEEVVKKSAIQYGVCTVFSIGSTSAVLLNENDQMLIQDIKNSLKKIAPEEQIYSHSENATSHIKSIMVGNSQTVPVNGGKLMLGTWQSVMVANFDVKDREREIVITIVGE